MGQRLLVEYLYYFIIHSSCPGTDDNAGNADDSDDDGNNE